MMFPGGQGQNTASYQKQFDNGIQPVVMFQYRISPSPGSGAAPSLKKGFAVPLFFF